MEQLTVGVRQAGQMTGLSHFTILQKVRLKELPAIRIGRRILISIDDLRGWLEEHRQAAREGQK